MNVFYIGEMREEEREEKRGTYGIEEACRNCVEKTLYPCMNIEWYALPNFGKFSHLYQ